MIPIHDIRAKVIELLRGETHLLPRSCLYHAIATRMILGPEATIVAGSTQWRYTSHDDGENSTHFSFIYDSDPRSVIAGLMAGCLPEMHIFNIYENKILDTSTKYLPQAAKLIAGFEWEPKMLPPDYLFTEKLVGPNSDWVYRPDVEASRFALKVVADALSRL